MKEKRIGKKAICGLLCLVMLLTGVYGMSVCAAGTTYTLNATNDADAGDYGQHNQENPNVMILRQSDGTTPVANGTVIHGGDTIEVSNIEYYDSGSNKEKFYFQIDGASQTRTIANSGTLTLTVPDNETGYYYRRTLYWANDGVQIRLSTIPAPDSDHTHSYSQQTVSEASETQDGEEIYVCSCGDIADRKVTTAMGTFWDNAIKKITDAKAGDTVVIESNLWNSYPQRFLEAIAARRDITIQITFRYKAKNWQVIIPKDVPIDTSFEWYGPEKMTQMFGRTEIVK